LCAGRRGQLGNGRHANRIHRIGIIDRRQGSVLRSRTTEFALEVAYLHREQREDRTLAGDLDEPVDRLRGQSPEHHPVADPRHGLLGIHVQVAQLRHRHRGDRVVDRTELAKRRQ
jgi:hypothetical protein